MSSMKKCTSADSGASTGSGEVCTVQCAVCSLVHVTGTLNQISLSKTNSLNPYFKKIR